MTLTDLIRKLTSRKLWMALAGVATGIATMMGTDSNDIATISGAVLSAASILGYLSAESAVDAARVIGENEQKVSEEAEKTLQEVCK